VGFLWYLLDYQVYPMPVCSVGYLGGECGTLVNRECALITCVSLCSGCAFGALREASSLCRQACLTSFSLVQLNGSASRSSSIESMGFARALTINYKPVQL
jgi:hypothetical protein